MEEEVDITKEEVDEEIQNEEMTLNDSVRQYIKEISRYELFDENHQNELLKKYKETKNQQIKEELIKHNLRLAVFVAKKYAFFCQSMTVLDLIQECSLTLLDAIEKYDIEKGAKFSTYAVKAMKRNLQRGIDNQDSLIKKPVNVEINHYRYKKFVETYKEKYKRNPTNEEIKEALGINDEQLDIQKNFETLNPSSLNKTIEVGDSEGDELESFISYTEEGYSSYEDYIDMKIKVIAIKKILSKKEYYVFYNRYVSNPIKTLDELGKEFDLTRERVRQIECKALKKIRPVIKKYEEKVIEEYNIEEIDKENIEPVSPKNITLYKHLKEQLDDITYYFFYNQKENNYTISDFVKKIKFLQKKEIKEIYYFCKELDRNMSEINKIKIYEEAIKNSSLTEIFEIDIMPKRDLLEIKKNYQKKKNKC